MHFLCPRKIRRRHEELHSALCVLLEQFLDVIHSDPDPSFTSALAALTKINSSLVTVHAGEFASAPSRILEAQLIHIEAQARFHVFYTQNRLAIFEEDAR